MTTAPAPTAPATADPATVAPSTNLPATQARTRQTPARGTAPRTHRNRTAARQAVEANTTNLDFSVGQTHVHVTLPPLDKLAFYAGLAGAAAFGLVEWPIAIMTGVGHLLSDDRHNRALRAMGEALDAAA